MVSDSANHFHTRNTSRLTERCLKLCAIEINIKRDTGQSVSFEFGKVLLTLHFRQSKPNYFEQ